MGETEGVIKWLGQIGISFFPGMAGRPGKPIRPSRFGGRTPADFIDVTPRSTVDAGIRWKKGHVTAGVWSGSSKPDGFEEKRRSGDIGDPREGVRRARGRKSGTLDQILEFLMVFVDRCHHAKEEDYLFPSLEQAGVSKEGGPIGVMLLEHQKGRDFIRGMSAEIPGVKRGDGPAIGRFVRNASGYRELLLAHIDKEDNVLYPMADALLSEDKDRELTKDFERVEEERVGQGKHEEFHRMMDRLRRSTGLTGSDDSCHGDGDAPCATYIDVCQCRDIAPM
jgi:hemerythrin-like domain-containing protein